MDMFDAIEMGDGIINTHGTHWQVIATLMRCMEQYRALYESTEKKLLRYRDIAGKPDLPAFSANKDCYSTIDQAKRAYQEDNETHLAFVDWLFDKHKDGKEYNNAEVRS